MAYLKWGGKKFYPQKPKPYVSDVNQLMKPLSEKVGTGNIWGSVITNVYKESVTPTPPPSWTPAEMTNLNDWWRADTGVNLTGSNVNSWEGYNGTLFSPNTPTGLKATYTLSSANWNGQSVITINPTSSTSSGGYSAYTSGGAITKTSYIVARINSLNSDERGFFTMEDGTLTNTDRTAFIGRTVDTPNLLWRYEADCTATGSVYFSTGVEGGVGSYVFGAIEYNASAATKTMNWYVSNTSTLGFSVGTRTGTKTPTDIGFVNLGMYCAFLPLYGMSLDVVEVIVVNGLLNPTDLIQLENYLNTRYGI